MIVEGLFYSMHSSYDQCTLSVSPTTPAGTCSPLSAIIFATWATIWVSKLGGYLLDNQLIGLVNPDVETECDDDIGVIGDKWNFQVVASKATDAAKLSRMALTACEKTEKPTPAPRSSSREISDTMTQTMELKKKE